MNSTVRKSAFSNRPRKGFSALRERSLVLDAALKVCLAGIGLALVFAAFSLPFLRERESQRMLDHLAELASNVEGVVRAANFAGDESLPVEVANGLIRNRLVAAVRITSGEKILAEVSKRGKSPISWNAGHVVRQRVGLPGDEKDDGGSITLLADTDFIKAQAASDSGFTVLLLLLESIAVSLLVAGLVLRSIVRPIKLFSDELHLIHAHRGEHVVPPVGNEHNEIGQLASDFNNLIDGMANLLAQEQVIRDQSVFSEHRFRSLAENSPDIIARYDCEFRRTYVNPSYARATGTPIERALNSSTDDVEIWRPAMPREEYKARLQRVMDTGIPDQILLEWPSADGLCVSHEMYVVAEYDAEGRGLGTLAIGREITERKRIEALMQHQASYDMLTGLPNRRMFSDRLGEEILRAGSAGYQLALLFIDLDRFKEVNDTMGHNVGDRLLVEAARRIGACVRESDMVARLGGDEFVVVMCDVEEMCDLARIAKTIIEVLAAPFLLDERPAYVSASIGIACYPADAESMEMLLSYADQAMYAAKDQGRNGFSFFTAAMQEQAQQRLLLANDLRDALSKGQLQVWLQPIVDVATGQVRKAEALLRWQHPSRGMVPPTLFIPVAEEMGLIHEIGEWVFREAALAAKRWQGMLAMNDATGVLCQISVNVSPRQFVNGHIGEPWIAYLGSIGLPPACMVLEITEGLLLGEQGDIMSKLSRFREAGIQVALDDFGTGYSAMAYLKKFNIDYLKIDRSFVRDLETDANDCAITEAIVVMAHKLGIKVIAEGVETTAQSDILSNVDCDFVQGYLYAKPMPTDAFLAYVRGDNAGHTGQAHQPKNRSSHHNGHNGHNESPNFQGFR